MWRQRRGRSVLKDRPHRAFPQALPAGPDARHEEERPEGRRDLDGRIQTQYQPGLEYSLRGARAADRKQHMSVKQTSQNLYTETFY